MIRTATAAAALSLGTLVAGAAVAVPAGAAMGTPAAPTSATYRLTHLTFVNGSLVNKPSCRRGAWPLVLSARVSRPAGTAAPTDWKARITVRASGKKVATVRAVAQAYAKQLSLGIRCGALATLMKHGFGADRARPYVYRIAAASARVDGQRVTFRPGARVRSKTPNLVKPVSVRARPSGSSKFRITGSFVRWTTSRNGHHWKPAHRRVKFTTDACGNESKRSRASGKFAFTHNLRDGQLMIFTHTSTGVWGVSKRGRLTPALMYGGC